MLRQIFRQKQRYFHLLVRKCHTEVQGGVDSLIGRNKIKGVPPTHVNTTDKQESEEYLKSTPASLNLKPYVHTNTPNNSMVLSSNFPIPPYTKIIPNNPKNDNQISQEEADLKGFLNIESQREQHLKLSLPFDNVPGPEILKLAAKFYSYLPLVGTQITSSAMMYFLNMIGTNLVWNRSARPFMHMFEKYGPVVRLQGIFGGNIVFVSHPEHIQTVFQHEGRYPVRSSLDSIEKYRTQYRNMHILGPFITSGPEWEVLRKNLETSLSSIASHYHNKIEFAAEEMISRIRTLRNRQEEVPSSFNEDIYKWALENTGIVLLGKRLGLVDPAGLSITSESIRLLEAIQNASKALRSCESGFQLWRFFETRTWRALVSSCDIIDNIVSKYVRIVQHDLENRKENTTSNVVTEKKTADASLLEMLVLKGKLQPNDILTIILDTLLIGVNAVSHAFSFLLYYLAKNPRAQRKAFNEIITVLPEKDSSVSYTNLFHLPYLHACLQESLRLQPPIPVMTRVLPQDIALYNYRIPKGTFMLMTSHVASLKEENFEDPHKFKPERWISDEEGIHPFAAIPFGHGARSCVGRRFAEMQLWLMAAKVIRNFHIEYHYGNIKTNTRLIAMPTKPLKFRFVERSK